MVPLRSSLIYRSVYRSAGAKSDESVVKCEEEAEVGLQRVSLVNRHWRLMRTDIRCCCRCCCCCCSALIIGLSQPLLQLRLVPTPLLLLSLLELLLSFAASSSICQSEVFLSWQQLLLGFSAENARHVHSSSLPPPAPSKPPPTPSPLPPLLT